MTVADELPASGIRFVLDQTLPEEGYRLDVTPEGRRSPCVAFPGFFLRRAEPAADAARGGLRDGACARQGVGAAV